MDLTFSTIQSDFNSIYIFVQKNIHTRKKSHNRSKLVFIWMFTNKHIYAAIDQMEHGALHVQLIHVHSAFLTLFHFCIIFYASNGLIFCYCTNVRTFHHFIFHSGVLFFGRFWLALRSWYEIKLYFVEGVNFRLSLD